MSERCWCGHKPKHHASVTPWCDKCSDDSEGTDPWHGYRPEEIEPPAHLNEQVREGMAPTVKPLERLVAGSPRAVVYRLDDRSLHELFIEGTATVVVTNGGIMVQHEHAAVDSIVSVRPYEGEKQHATEGDGEQGPAQADLDGA